MKFAFTKKTMQAFKRLPAIGKVAICFFLAIWLFIFIICLVPVEDKELLTPGVASNASSEISVNDGTTNIFTVGVYDKIGLSLFQYWVASKEDAFALLDYTKDTELSQADEEVRGAYLKALAEINAVIAAYDAAIAYETAHGYTPTVSYTKNYQGLIVTAIMPNAITDLKYGDVITAVNDKAITSYASFKSIVTEAISEGASSETIPFEFTVQRDGKEMKVATSARREASAEGRVYFSFELEIFDYYTIAEGVKPAFSISSTTSYGSSGGAMLTLSLYASLLASHEDITKGLLIAGTGTIDADGKVGEIAGVEQKIRTFMLSNYQGIDLFFVPSANYTEALATAEAINATFKVVKVDSLADILSYLASYVVEEASS